MSVPDLLSLSAMSLATTGQDGEAHLAPVYFVAAERMQLYFFSDEESQHASDLVQDARAAVAIYPECEGWQDIRGLQMRGTVRPVPPGPEWERAWTLYQAKFPFAAELKDVVARSTFYLFIPKWVRLLDNRRGFGFKQEWTIP